MDYSRTSKLETLEGSIGRIQVSVYRIVCCGRSVQCSSLFILTSLTLVVARPYAKEGPVGYDLFVAWFCAIIVLRSVFTPAASVRSE